MSNADLAATIDEAWEQREKVSPQTKGAWREAVAAALDGLDEGKLRVAEPAGGQARGWQVHQWLKKAVLLSFRLNDMVEIPTTGVKYRQPLVSFRQACVDRDSGPVAKDRR